MYIGDSMSVRAAQAYDRGLKPVSRWSKNDIVEAVSSKTNDVDFIEETKKLPVEVLREVLLIDVEWHHTSKRYNETWFMDVIEINDEKIPELFKKLTAAHQALKAKKTATRIKKNNTVPLVYEANVEYEVPYNYGKQYYQRSGIGVVYGEWCYLFDGHRKRIGGKHLRIISKIKDLPSSFDIKAWSAVQKEEYNKQFLCKTN